MAPILGDCCEPPRKTPQGAFVNIRDTSTAYVRYLKVGDTDADSILATIATDEEGDSLCVYWTGEASIDDVLSFFRSAYAEGPAEVFDYTVLSATERLSGTKNLASFTDLSVDLPRENVQFVRIEHIGSRGAEADFVVWSEVDAGAGSPGNVATDTVIDRPHLIGITAEAKYLRSSIDLIAAFIAKTHTPKMTRPTAKNQFDRLLQQYHVASNHLG